MAGDVDRVGMALVLKGVAVSTGIVRGPAHVLVADPQMVAPPRPIEESEVPDELSRFRAALTEAASDLVGLQRGVRDRIGAAAADIFDAQVLALKDPLLMEQVEGVVRSRKVNVESALAEVIEGFSKTLAEAAAVYMRERAADVRDVGRRILSVLIRRQRVDGQPVPAGCVVVAEELLPSATARMDLQHVRGFVTERGGKTSHACILARSLGIPAVTGVKEATQRIRTGDELIIDAMAGTVFVNPAETIRHEYERLESDIRAYQDSLKGLVDLPAQTKDGVGVTLMSNLGKMADAEAALLFNADGVGLYTSIAVASDGRIFVSYYDEAGGNLKFAVFDGAWDIDTLDSAGTVGQYTSIALSSLDLPFVSYYDATNGDLKYAWLK